MGYMSDEIRFEVTPRPNLLREGVSLMLKNDSWNDIKESVGKLTSDEVGRRAVADVFSEVAIKFNNLGGDGLSSGNYTQLRELIDVVCGSPSLSNGTDIERANVFVPLFWLGQLKGVNDFLETTDGVMKGGIKKYLFTAENTIWSYLMNEENRSSIDEMLNKWVEENKTFLIPSKDFYQ